MSDFATWEDVEKLWHPLSEEDQTAVTERLIEASALLRIVVPDIDIRADADANVADLATAKVVNAVLRVMQNPMGARQMQEAAGPFSHSLTLTGGGTSGVFYTDEELKPLQPAVAQIGTSYVGIRRGWAPEAPYRRQGWAGGPLLPPVDQGRGWWW